MRRNSAEAAEACNAVHGAIAEGGGAVQRRSADATSWQARQRVHAPSRWMYWATSAALLAPKATAGFMNCVRPVSKQCVQRYNFFIGSLSDVCLAFLFIEAFDGFIHVC